MGAVLRCGPSSGERSIPNAPAFLDQKLSVGHLVGELEERHFTLKLSKDSAFWVCLQNLLQAGSSVLAPENREHWDMLLQSEHGSAGLMEQLREYTGTLASNMKLTYLNPVGVVTPNISE